MTAQHTFTPHQALARDVLLAAVNSGTQQWARVRGYTDDCAPEHVCAEGIDVASRSLGNVTLPGLERASAKPSTTGPPVSLRTPQQTEIAVGHEVLYS